MGYTLDTFGGNSKDEVRNFFKEDGYGELMERFESCKTLLKYDFKNVFPFHYKMIQGDALNTLKEFVLEHNNR